MAEALLQLGDGQEPETFRMVGKVRLENWGRLLDGSDNVAQGPVRYASDDCRSLILATNDGFPCNWRLIAHNGDCVWGKFVMVGLVRHPTHLDIRLEACAPLVFIKILEGA